MRAENKGTQARRNWHSKGGAINCYQMAMGPESLKELGMFSAENKKFRILRKLTHNIQNADCYHTVEVL